MNKAKGKLKKAEAKLNRRIGGYDTAKAIADKRRAGGSKALTKPGSMNPRKQG